MCRYAMYGPYKRHFACFACRKGFKRASLPRVEDAADDPAPCPDCGQPMSDMGLDLKPPKRSDAEHWAVVAFLYRRGFAYRSCGCDGPGYRPSRWAEVLAFLESHKCRSAGELLTAKFAARSGYRRHRTSRCSRWRGQVGFLGFIAHSAPAGC